MATIRHRRWNIAYDPVMPSKISTMRPDVVADWVNSIQRQLAESRFLLACHGDGMTVPEELRNDWPAVDYVDEQGMPVVDVVALGALANGLRRDGTGQWRVA
jgi:hypothetical protein